MNALTGQPSYFTGGQQPQPMGQQMPQPQPYTFQPNPQPFQQQPSFGQNQFQQPSQLTQPQMPQMPTQTFVPQGQNRSSFTGRYVNSIDEVVLSEIPMDGTPAIFPTKDAQAIYLKVWNQNGNLLTARYVLDPVQPDQTIPTQPPMDDILDRLNKLESALATRKAKPKVEKEDQ